MMVNHPTYIVGCSDSDIRQLVARGVKMEHSICPRRDVGRTVQPVAECPNGE
jgi:hypothetical protein